MQQRIVILKFEEYNPRKDRRRHSWMRVNNTIIYGLKKLTPAQKWFWVALLSLASFKQQDWVKLDYEDLQKDTGVELEDMKKAIEYFADPNSGDDGKPMIKLMTAAEYESYLIEKAAKEVSGNQLVTSRLPSGNPTYIHTDDTLHTNSTIVGHFSKKDEKLAKKLSSEPVLVEALQLIEQEIIKQWVKKYDYDQLAQSLGFCIDYYLQKTKAGNVARINDLPSKLIRWVNNDKKLNVANSGLNALDFLDDLNPENHENAEVGHGS